MKNIITLIRYKICAISLIVQGKPVLFMPIKDLSNVGYIHLEVSGKDCAEMVDMELEFE